MSHDGLHFSQLLSRVRECRDGLIAETVALIKKIKCDESLRLATRTHEYRGR